MIFNQSVLASEDRQGLGMGCVFRLLREPPRYMQGCSTVIYTSFGGPGPGNLSHLGRLIPCPRHHHFVLARSRGGDMGIRGKPRFESQCARSLVLSKMIVLYTVSFLETPLLLYRLTRPLITCTLNQDLLCGANDISCDPNRDRRP